MGETGADQRPFVGRIDELRRFDKILTAPEGQAVLVVGQAGMGKTMLLDRMARCARDHPELKCGAVRYEVTPTDPVAGTMALMIDHAHRAAQLGLKGGAKLVSGTEGQWQALFKTAKLFPVVGNTAEAIGQLALSLVRDPAKDTRTQFMDRLRLISAKMPADARAVFMVDPEKYMQPGSQDDWRLVVRDLPERIKFVFAQRPEDVLVSSRDFGALPNVRRIPDDRLDVLEEAAVEDLLALRRDDLKVPLDQVRPAIARYAGHPYAIPAALNLIADGLPVEDLPGDPTPEHIAEAQWNRVCDRHGRDAIELFRALAILEVGVPDEVFRHVSRLDSAACAALLANAYLRGLLRREEDGRRIYHALLADHIRGQLSEEEAKPYHQRAVQVYRQRLKAETKPDALGAVRLPDHVLAAEGADAFVQAFIDECTPALLTLGALDAAVALSHRALGEFVEEGSGNEAGVLGNLGLIYQMRGDLDEAEWMHRKALEIDKQLGLLDGLAIEYGNLGLIYQARGHLDEADAMHRMALEIEKKLGRLEGIARQYGNLAVSCRRRGDLDDAERMLRKTLGIEEKLQHLEGIANVYSNLGLIYRDRGDLDEAVRMQGKALEIDQKLGRLEGVSAQYCNLGLIYHDRGDLDEAERLHRKAFDITEQLGLLEGMGAAYANLGVIAKDRGDLGQARELWTKSRDLYAQIGIPHMVEKVQGWIDRLGNAD